MNHKKGKSHATKKQRADARVSRHDPCCAVYVSDCSVQQLQQLHRAGVSTYEHGTVRPCASACTRCLSAHNACAPSFLLVLLLQANTGALGQAKVLTMIAVAALGCLYVIPASAAPTNECPGWIEQSQWWGSVVTGVGGVVLMWGGAYCSKNTGSKGGRQLNDKKAQV